MREEATPSLGFNEYEEGPSPEAEDRDEFNEDTFGKEEIHTGEFDFSESTLQFMKNLSISKGSASTQLRDSVDDAKTVMMAKSQKDSMSLPKPPGFSNAGAQLLELLRKPSMPLTPPPGITYSMATFPSSIIPVKPVDKYAGIMTDYDITRIHNIQVSQLISDHPYQEDFYYYNYTKRLNMKKSTIENNSRSIKDTLYLPLPHIPQKFMNKGPRPTHLVIEGALGKVALNSLKKPKQSIVVERPTSESQLPSSTVPHQKSKTQILRSIESVYLAINSIQDIYSDSDPKDFRTIAQKKTEAIVYEKLIEKELGLGSFKKLNHFPIVEMINSGMKGQKLIKKAVEFLGQNQLKQEIFEQIFAGVQYLSVIMGTPCGKDEDRIIQNILPMLIAFVSETNWDVLQSWFEILLNKTHLVAIAAKKIGHLLFCVLMSRAEMLKTTQSSVPSTWKYNIQHLFHKLRHSFTLLFSHTLNILNNPGFSNRFNPEDEYYAWQFFALFIHNLDSELTHELIAELRPIILYYANHENLVAVNHVNLLLHIIDLDASQLKIQCF